MSEHVEDRAYWYRIDLCDENCGRTIDKILWPDLTWDVRKKWGWYFRYRAALLLVQNPRLCVRVDWGSNPREPDDVKLQRSLKNKLTAKKRKITEMQNKITLARKHWNQLFPIEEHPQYKDFVRRLERHKKDLEEIKSKIISD